MSIREWFHMNQHAWMEKDENKNCRIGLIFSADLIAIFTWARSEFMSYPPLLCIWFWMALRWFVLSSASFDPICPAENWSFCFLDSYRTHVAFSFYLCEQNSLDSQSLIDLFAYVDDDVVCAGWDFVVDGSSMKTIAPKYHQCLPYRCFSSKFLERLKHPRMWLQLKKKNLLRFILFIYRIHLINYTIISPLSNRFNVNRAKLVNPMRSRRVFRVPVKLFINTRCVHYHVV